MLNTKIEKLGKCLTKRTLVDFDTKVKEFAQFYRVSQFTQPQPKSLAECRASNRVCGFLFETPYLGTGEILYGVSPDADGTFVFLGEIIDSGD